MTAPLTLHIRHAGDCLVGSVEGNVAGNVVLYSASDGSTALAAGQYQVCRANADATLASNLSSCGLKFGSGRHYCICSLGCRRDTWMAALKWPRLMGGAWEMEGHSAGTSQTLIDGASQVSSAHEILQLGCMHASRPACCETVTPMSLQAFLRAVPATLKN